MKDNKTIMIDGKEVCLDTLFQTSEDLKKARLQLNQIAEESKKKATAEK